MKKLLSYLYIAIGSFLVAFGLNMFLIPHKIAIGGVSGIATILLVKFSIPVSITAIVLNLILFLVGFKTLSKSAIFKTLYASVLLSVFLELTKNFATITDDMLLVSIYGGLLAGVGIGICIANNASTGGSDFLAIMINKFIPHFSVGNIILAIDAIVVFASAYFFDDYTLVLYCFLALALNIKATDYIVDGVDFAKSTLIISDKYEEISNKILYDFNRGVTSIYCKGMYTKSNKIALLCIVTPQEVTKLKKLVKKIDKDAFIILTDVKQTLGEGFREYI